MMLEKLHIFVEVNNAFVHMSQTLCCLIAWNLELRSISRLWQA